MRLLHRREHHLGVSRKTGLKAAPVHRTVPGHDFRTTRGSAGITAGDDSYIKGINHLGSSSGQRPDAEAQDDEAVLGTVFAFSDIWIGQSLFEAIDSSAAAACGRCLTDKRRSNAKLALADRRRVVP